MPPAPAVTASMRVDACPPEDGPGHAVLDSQRLLRGGTAVAIRHNGAVYRLQTTRLGKLILTK